MAQRPRPNRDRIKSSFAPLVGASATIRAYFILPADYIALTVLMLSLLSLPGAGDASEFGISTYRPGISDLYAGYLVPPGQTLLRNMFLFQDAHESASTQDGRFEASSHTLTYTEAILAIHVTRFSLLGSHWGFGTILQVRLADQTLRAGPRGRSAPQQSSTVAGLGDLIVMPMVLNWDFGRFHVVTALAFYAPTGSYDTDRIINIGVNRWAVEPDVGITWMDEKRSIQASLFTGYTVNTENTSTHYSSGQEFHADFVLGRHFTRDRVLGIAGYALQQTTADSGPGAVLGPFKGRVIALGPLSGETFNLGELPVHLSLKYLFEFAAENRSSGNELWLNAILRF